MLIRISAPSEPYLVRPDTVVSFFVITAAVEEKEGRGLRHGNISTVAADKRLLTLQRDLG